MWAGVECLAVFILDCGLFLPATQVSSARKLFFVCVVCC